VANKWDLLSDDPVAQKTLREDVRRRFVFTRGAAFLTVSAKTGAGVSKILPEADAVARRSTLKIPTGELNRVLKKAFEAQLPKARSGRELKIRYAVQIASEPPLIRLFSDRDEPLHFTFERFLQNRLREKWDLAGVPIRFVVRKGE
ncbi:MAG TPA: ribosome biogenesis GTPase Der, partial [Thermoanaerobaculia bacterium]|nr:ribosome biogenesis GTPase Der [Thermoanaerobaculia bacterium]